MARKWPPIPRSVMGAGGPITVKLVDAIEPDAGKPVGDNSVTFGIWEGPTRTIRIVKGLDPAFQWSVLQHELVHSALFDAGVTNLLPPEQEECLADAISTARVAEMRGVLRLP